MGRAGAHRTRGRPYTPGALAGEQGGASSRSGAVEAPFVPPDALPRARNPLAAGLPLAQIPVAHITPATLRVALGSRSFAGVAATETHVAVRALATPVAILPPATPVIVIIIAEAAGALPVPVPPFFVTLVSATASGALIVIIVVVSEAAGPLAAAGRSLVIAIVPAGSRAIVIIIVIVAAAGPVLGASLVRALIPEPVVSVAPPLGPTLIVVILD